MIKYNENKGQLSYIETIQRMKANGEIILFAIEGKIKPAETTLTKNAQSLHFTL